MIETWLLAAPLALVPAGLVAWLARRLQRAQARAQGAEALLRHALEATPGAMLIYDADERLLACNAEARAQHARVGAPSHPGASVEDVLRAFAASGLIPAAKGREDAWVAERLATFRAADPAGEERLVDGRWHKIYFRPLEGGGRLVLRLDVAESRAREAALAESERRFRELAEVSSDWFWRSDAEHRFLPPAEDNTRGIGPGRPGATRWEVADPGDLAAEPEKWARHMADLAARRPFRDFCYWAIEASGRRVYVRTSGRPVFDADGAFVGYRGVSADLTAQVVAERSAAAAQSRLAEAIENLPLGVALYDAEDRLVICNSRCRAFFPAAAELMQPGADREKILQAAADRGDIARWQGRGAAMVAELRAAVARGEPHFELELASGRWLSRMEHRTSDGGRVVAYADVSELKRQAEELREKSALLRATLDNIAQGLVVFGPDLKLLAWNQAYFTIANLPLSLARPGVSARALSDAVLAQSADADGVDPEARFREFVRLDPARMEVRLKDGRTLEIVRRRMPDGGMVVTTSDITELKRREEELAAKTSQMQIVFENLAEGVSVVDKDLNVVAFNPEGLRLLGFPQERMPRFEDYIRFNAERGEYGPGDVDQLVAERVALARQFQPHAFERTRPDGTVIEVRGNPVPGGGFVTTYRDVTEQRRAEETLRRAKEQAELASRAKSEFLANTSHELRTPLNAILGFSEIIMHQMFGPIGERYLEYARDIHRSGSHLLSIINDLLDLAKVESGRFDMHEGPIEVREVVEVALRFVAERAQAAGVTATLNVADDAPLLHGDERALKQAILNLLSNAVKFTPEGGRVNVAVSLAADGWLEVAVADTGIGMSPRDIEVALTPFGQVESAFNRRYEGTGLGLPLARRFVELHGGALIIESEPAVGTTVTARFPPDRLIWPEAARSAG